MNWTFITLSQNMPFSIAITIVLMIAILEGVGLLLGAGISHILENMLPPSFELEIEGPDLEVSSTFSKVLTWLKIGKIPVLVWLIIHLVCFGLVGFMIQLILMNTVHWVMPGVIAAFVSLFLALPIARFFINGVSKLIPKDESSAVSLNDLVGRVAKICLGCASYQNPTRAKVKDKFGKTHYILVEPDCQNNRFHRDEQVLLVSRKNSIYYAIENVNQLMEE